MTCFSHRSSQRQIVGKGAVCSWTLCNTEMSICLMLHLCPLYSYFIFILSVALPTSISYGGTSLRTYQHMPPAYEIHLRCQRAKHKILKEYQFSIPALNLFQTLYESSVCFRHCVLMIFKGRILIYFGSCFVDMLDFICTFCLVFHGGRQARCSIGSRQKT
jgi:hypothetical protein